MEIIRPLDETWKTHLKEEMDKEYFHNLMQFVSEEYKNNECFPPLAQVFSAFQFTSFEATKVVVLGQDPYHDKGQAHGLSFSVPDGVAIPRSLLNIFKEISHEYNAPLPLSGNLTHWAKQGVLLLNATLTVRAHQAGSHQKKGWEQFTDAVIEKISTEKEHVVFLLWGGFAKKKIKLIDTEKHVIFSSGHPSPLSANRGLWFGNEHFLRTNEQLKKWGRKEICWIRDEGQQRLDL